MKHVLKMYDGHLLFLQASTDRVGILTGTPAASLHVGGNVLIDSHITASGHVSASVYYGDGSNLTGINAGISYSRRAVTSTITASTSDAILGVSASAALDIRLPAASGYSAGQYFTVKDEAGNATTYNITIRTTGADEIDGVSSIVLESPYAAVNLYCDGSSKFFIY